MRTLNQILTEMRSLCDELESHIGQNQIKITELKYESHDPNPYLMKISEPEEQTMNFAAGQPYYGDLTTEPIKPLTADDMRLWK